MPEIHETAARGFARAADAYERGRPSYPAEAIEFMVEITGLDESSTVIDLAAGTGKLSRRLLPRAGHLIAVEPVPEMRAKLAELLPQVEVREGSAEDIPLPDMVADLVTVGQAFHWFDGVAALREIHRILRPEGRLALLWNLRDDSAEWSARLSELIGPHRPGEVPDQRSGEWKEAFRQSDLFGPLEERWFSYQEERTPDDVVDHVASMSVVAALPAGEQEELLTTVRHLLAEHPETTGRERILVPYETVVYWCGRA